MAKRSAVEFYEDGCTQHAAALSYYGLFALFPLMILTIVVLGLVASEATVRDTAIELVEENLPVDRAGEGHARVRDALEGVTDSPAGLGIAGLAGLLFAATGLMGSLRTALNAAWDKTYAGRPPIRGKLFDLMLVFSAGLVVLLSLALTVVTQVEQLAFLARLSPAVMSFLVFASLYRVVPTGKVTFREAIPGAIFAALVFELLKAGFAFFVENFANYNAVYGSVGAVIIFLFFVFLAANVFLLGAEISSESRGFRRRIERRPDQPSP